MLNYMGFCFMIGLAYSFLGPSNRVPFWVGFVPVFLFEILCAPIFL